MNRISLFLFFTISFTINSFDIVNQTTQTIKTNFISIPNSGPSVKQTYQTDPNDTRTITLPSNSTTLRIEVFNPRNLTNSQQILVFKVVGELLQNLKTSSTARILIKNINNFLVARIIR